MKRVKDGERIMEPMFPRLHVKDAEKGGPRAPPRNKMALYEQLSIPSHRFSNGVLPCNTNNTSANLMPPMSPVTGGGNDRGTFISSQMHLRPQPEPKYSQYSSLSTPLVERKKRKKLDDDDYTVPVFDYSASGQEFDKFSNDMNQEILSSSNTNCTAQSTRTTEKDMIEHRKNEECRNQVEKNPQGSMACWVKYISSPSSTGNRECPKEQTISSLSREPSDKPGNSIDRLKTNGSLRTELCIDLQPSDAGQNSDEAEMGMFNRRNSPNSKKILPSENNAANDLSDDSESNEMESLDSVSEISILDTVSTVDVTPDDVVGVLGQKQFWKARRAIANQQRVFAVQVFELHRLIKVQKLIAASPHLLLEASAYLGKPIKAFSRMDTPLKAIPNAPKHNNDLEKPKGHKEGSAENTVPANNQLLPPKSHPINSNSQEQSNVNSDCNTNLWYQNQPQGHQWLVPVMSPSEGLIYKPYPAPGFVGQDSGGCGPPGSIPMTSSFFTPPYGFPFPPAQYQLHSVPPFAPHGYFPSCSMPIMNTAVFSGSSVEQMVSQRNRTVTDTGNSHISEYVEVQVSTTSSQSERQQSSYAVGGRNMLPLFPMHPAINASKPDPRLEAVPGRPTAVIRVVPHNSISASESAARIFRAIQEGRKQYDSV